MTESIKEYCRTRVPCQLCSYRKPLYRFNGSSDISRMFHCWSFDFLGHFHATSNNLIYLLVCVEALSGYLVAEATESTTANAVIITLNYLRYLDTLQRPVSTCGGASEDWCTRLGSAFRGILCIKSKRIGRSPYEYMLGIHPRLQDRMEMWYLSILKQEKFH
ncbi:hypothetical protein AYI69_g10201 [Smittium culicis]|uniref:Integrase catalytic domain-containing protein n=1 Tax=Smittium culicis TaxID=133412 RepID=A0A1R1X7C6_9FUNG|nr:hypothetical protein AYI69_g10201 [Smittium culicis]